MKYFLFYSTGKLDARGRPIPGLAKLPHHQPKSAMHSNVNSYNMQQDEYRFPPVPVRMPPLSSTSKGENAAKIYVGGMPPSLSESHLHVYFSQFGTVVNVTLVRDRETGISKGFGFVTFARDEEAGNVVTMMGNHIIERRPVRVSFASKHGQEQASKKGKNNSEVLDAMHLPEQARLYMGPLEEDVIANDVTKQFCQFGTVQMVQRIRASETTVKKSFGYVDYQEGSSAVCRAFGIRAFVKGRHVHLSLSRFAMELLLSDTCIFFYEAYEYCDEKHLEQHFSKFGQVYRAIHIRNDPTVTHSNDIYPWKNYGFIDFVSHESSVRALEMKTQLLHPGQYVKVGRALPQVLLFDLMAISDRYGTEIKKRLELHQAHGTWGDSKYIYGNVTTTQVRIPATMIGKLIGERGKSIAEITRDSKVKISIPKTEQSVKHVIVSITGQTQNIKTAQYLMQKLLKGQK